MLGVVVGEPATVTFVWLLAFGVPYPLLLALFVALMDLIPMVGSTIGGIVVSLVALTASVPVAITTLGFYIVYRLLEDYLLVPRVMASTVKTPGAVTLVAVLLGGTLLGIPGALVAIPAAAAVQLVLNTVVFPGWTVNRGWPTRIDLRRRWVRGGPCFRAVNDPVHVDLTAANVLFDHNDRGTGVVDWNLSAYRGDRLFALVHTASTESGSPDHPAPTSPRSGGPPGRDPRRPDHPAHPADVPGTVDAAPPVPRDPIRSIRGHRLALGHGRITAGVNTLSSAESRVGGQVPEAM